MADLSALGSLAPFEPIDLGDYASSKEFTAIPKKGRYTVQAPDSFPSSSFGRTKAGALSIAVDPTIVGPSNEGYKLRFTKVSAKAFQRGGKMVSQAGDYLDATGFKGRVTNEQELADAIEATANTTYQVDIDWRAYNKDTGYSLEGMERFPKGENGEHLPWVEDPTAKDAEGNPVRLRANVVVQRYVPAGV